MPKKFRITAPDGKTYDITGPDGSTAEQALAQVQQMHGGAPEEPQIDLNHLFPAQAGPQSDDRTAGQVALDQAGNVVKGAVGAVTGIPGMLTKLGGIAYNTVAGNREAASKDASDVVYGVYHGVVDPVATSVRGAGAYVAPNKVAPPSRQDWETAAQGAGNLAGGIAVGEAVKSIPTSAEGIQGVANKLRAIRENAPTPGVPTTTMQAVKTGAGMAAAPVASVLEKAANLRAALDTNPVHTVPSLPAATPEITPNAEMGGPASYYHPPDAAPVANPVTPNAEMGGPSSFYHPQDAAPTANPIEPTPAVQQTLPNIKPDLPPTPQPGAPQGSISMSPEQVQQATAPPLIHPEAGAVIPRDIQMAREAILQNGAARSQANLIKVSRNVPELLKAVPELRGVPAGAGFDTRLFNAYKSVSHELNGIEASIPDQTPVPTGDAVSQLKSLESKYVETNQPAAVRAIDKVRSFLEERPSMEWGDFIKAKRAFFNEIKLSSGAGREAYQIFKKLSNDVSPELGDANQKYYTVKSALENANMDITNGEKIKTIGKASKSKPVGYETEAGKGAFKLPL